ncbi:PD-(D/E)XK nuclease family protein [Helicobacter canis]|uniref:PD-(D/E)XK nuclease family protein n=1 Tax=Helicobacter canis TaxID=29419 RepID=A0A377J676_9HELI|nr:PD-(D/E)XK nuclease family protein [Helicobacter canis]STO97795.1 Uncharacterised protein [Helicobacter canis]
MTDENLRLFLQRFREFNAEIEARKKRGQNDFNPLLCVQKLDDEENMHSGFLYALLNPNGEHYQDDLFLKLFVKSIGLQEWFGNTNNAEVHKEKKRIDMYITNGTKHIIVENKINAGDQNEQIARYIEAIAKVDSSDRGESSVEYENIAVVYLAPHIKNPTQQSLGKWKIQGDFLVDSENHQVRFRAISYENEIIDWLDSALNEAGGISNLRMAIECYTDVVKRLTGKKENTMDLQAFFSKDGNKQFLDIALELVARKDEVTRAHFSAIAREIKGKYKEYRTEVWSYGTGISVLHNKFVEIRNFCFYIAAEIANKEEVWFEIYLSGYNPQQTTKLIPKLGEVLGVSNDNFDDSMLEDGWLALKEFEEIDLKDFTQKSFMEFFESVKDKVYQFNQKIADDLAKPDSKLSKLVPPTEITEIFLPQYDNVKSGF